MLPDPVGGSDARAAARRELAKEIYHRDDPSPPKRLYDWILDQVQHLLDGVAKATSGSTLGALIVVGLLVAAVLLVLRQVGRPPVRDLLGDRSKAERARSAADERDQARRLAADGQWDEAIRCTVRALVRELEERGVLEPRPGRTPRGIATEAGLLVPASAGDVRAVTDAFELVWFGEQPATAELWAAARDAEARVRNARLAVTS